MGRLLMWVFVAGALVFSTACDKQKRAPGVAGKGQDLFAQKGCVACHSTDGSRKIGPSLKGVFGSKRTVVSNGRTHTLTADDAYLTRSITVPDADKVKGFETVPMIKVPLKPDEVTALIAFIKTLK